MKNQILSFLTALFFLGFQALPFGIPAVQTAYAEGEDELSKVKKAPAEDVIITEEVSFQKGPELQKEQAEEADHYVQTFIITVYNSPLPGQEHYATGSYESDIYLNGNGTNGADGTPVYPGMIAAPKTYAFGTKMHIPGIGTVAVHDRGGAIKSAGERGNEFDRLDIWMGHGDEGLKRALNWGKRTVDVVVYGVNPDVEEAVYFESYYDIETIVYTTILSPLEFPEDLYYGTDGDEVKKMQEYLIKWGYLTEANGIYDSETAQALYDFQVDFNLVNSPEELGAGHFGINTRTKFDNLIKLGDDVQETLKLQKGQTLLSKYTDLYEEKHLFASSLERGNSGDTVLRLQEELVKLGFMRIEPNGYFGEVTEHAVFKFQQSMGLVSSKDDSGAGYVGPATRSALNNIIESRYDMKSLFAYQREEVSAGRHIVQVPSSAIALTKEEE